MGQACLEFNRRTSQCESTLIHCASVAINVAVTLMPLPPEGYFLSCHEQGPRSWRVPEIMGTRRDLEQPLCSLSHLVNNTSLYFLGQNSVSEPCAADITLLSLSEPLRTHWYQNKTSRTPRFTQLLFSDWTQHVHLSPSPRTKLRLFLDSELNFAYSWILNEPSRISGFWVKLQVSPRSDWKFTCLRVLIKAYLSLGSGWNFE